MLPTLVCLVSAGLARVLLLGAVGWARVVSTRGWGGSTAGAEVASVVLSSIMWCHCSWQLSTVTPQAALTWMPKINCWDILQGYLLIQTTLVAGHNWNTDGPWYRGVVSGGRFLGLQFHLLLNGREPCCWQNNWFLLLYRTLALFAGEMSRIASALALVVCVCSQEAAACTPLTQPARGALLLAVQAYFVLVGKASATSHLCCLRDRRWINAVVLTLWTAFALLSLVRGRKRAFL